MPIRKLQCIHDGYTVEALSMELENFGLPQDFLRHFETEHGNQEPKEGVDYRTQDWQL